MGGRGGAKAAPGPRSPANGLGCTRGAHWSSLDHGARQLMHAPVPRSRPLSPSIPHAPSPSPSRLRLLGGVVGHQLKMPQRLPMEVTFIH